MSDNDSPFAEWYNEGSSIPVTHPIPEVSAEVYFPAEWIIEWKTENHKTGETTHERFELVEDE